MTKKTDTHYFFGLDSFGDLATKDDGTMMSYAESLRLVVDEAILAAVRGIGSFHAGFQGFVPVEVRPV